MADILILQEDHGKRYEVKPGTRIEVRLVDNPTTGYRWQVAEFDTQIINLQEKDFKTAEGAGIGSGGTRYFMFTANTPGTVKIDFLLSREWEPVEAAIDQFEITIHVKD